VDQTGTYVLTVTDITNGCTASDQVVVSSNTPIPVANAGSDQIITCTSSSVTLNGSSSSTGANYIYSWTGTLVSGQGTLTPVVNQAGIYTLTVKDTTDGCSSMDNVTVTINTNPPTANAGSDKNITCASPSVHLDGSGSSTGANFTYAWSGTITSGSGTLTPTVNQTGTYTLTVTNIANGCTASDAVVVSNTNGPTFSGRDSVDASCNLFNGQATITVAGGTPPYSAVWNSTPPQNGLTVFNVPSGLYTVTVTDNGGCTITESIFVGEISPPTATITSTSELCNMGNGTVSADASGGSGHYTYQWNTPLKDTTAVVNNLHNGNYTVTVSDGNCSIHLSVSVDNIPGPTASFVPDPQVLTTMSGPVFFFNNSTGNINEWQWYFGDGYTDTTQSPMHSYPNAGTYTISLVVMETNGCRDSVSDTVVVRDVFTLYIPNAFTPNGDGLNDLFYPEGDNIDPSAYEFEIYNRWGNMVYYTTNINGKWNGTNNNSGKVPDDCINGVYTYRVLAKQIGLGMQHEYVGSVTLYR
jgi:gliding motility-associated-like protein